MPEPLNVDSQVYDIADTFLQDNPHLYTQDNVSKLAHVIQDAIESEIAWMEDQAEEAKAADEIRAIEAEIQKP